MQEPESDDTISVHDGRNNAGSERLHQQSIYPERRAFNRMLVPFTARIMNAPLDGLDKEIANGLQDMAQFFGGDRALLWELPEDGRRAVLTHYHAETGAEPPTRSHLHETLPYIFDSILDLQNLCISELSDLPPEADLDRQYLEHAGIRSFLIVPLLVGGAPRGALSLACIRCERHWSNTDLFHFQRIGVVLASALDRQRSHRLLDQRMRFETMIADLSAAILKSTGDDTDREVEGGLARVAEFFRVDRCVLLGREPDSRSGRVTHAWYGEGIPRVPEDVNLADLFPWVYEKLVGERIHISTVRLADLPPEAEKDRQSWTQMGVRSTLEIPVIVGEHVDHAIVVQSFHEERAWPDEYIPRLRLLGELFVTALQRKKVKEDLLEAYDEIKTLKDRLEAENVYLQNEIKMTREIETIIGRSDAIKYVHFRISQVAPLDTTVLIVGETGTGKGLVAKAIHEKSPRKNRPMIHVNCAVLPANLIESELFGREKGAFTGAQAKQIGRFELANRGTIFLDEIAELPIELQAKLLRVIESGEFERLGDPHTVKVDVRIIASTNRNLEEEIRKGRFREDLFYRLNVFPITVPPLRQRVDDVPLIVDALIERLNKQLGRTIMSVPTEVMQALQNYAWPGNVRELENVIERAVIMSRGSALQLSEQLGASAAPASPVSETALAGLADVERAHIRKTLEALQWKIEGPKGAAHALGMKPSTLRDRMQKLNITRPRNS